MNEVYVRNLLTGLLCAGLAFWSFAAPARAQQPPAAPEAAPPASPDAEEPQMDGQPVGRLPFPAPIKIPDTRMPGERGIWLGVTAWGAKGDLGQFGGELVPHTNPTALDFSTKRKFRQGVELGIAVGLHNALRVIYTESQGSGTATSPTANLTLWNRAYPNGALLSTNYKLRNVKFSLDYLTWPYPVKSSRFRLKTLWQLQYTSVQTLFDAPQLPTIDENGDPIFDDSGNPVEYAGEGTNWFFLPTVGVAAQGYMTPRFSLEGSVSGFAFPGRQRSWEAEGAANIRFKSYSIRIGAKGFHFRTSPKGEYWIRGTMFGPFVSFRLHSDSDEPETRLR